MEFVHRLAIDAPVRRVAEVVADVEQWPRWTPTVASVRPLGAGPPAVGARYEVRQPKLPVATWTVTLLDPERGMVWEARGPGVRTVGEHLVEPAGSGALLTLRLVQEGPLGWVIGRAYAGLTRRYLTLEAEAFQRWCAEGAAPERTQ